ncbi:MAG: pentapeptide repeat-containing protein [Candidatus Bathyarchaeia archaeon]
MITRIHTISNYFATWNTSRILAIALLAVLFSIVFFGRIRLEDLPANIATEIGSIVITVLLIDALNERRAKQELKQQLIREMGSNNNGVTLRAVEELRAHGWLQDGSLSGMQFKWANLQRAYLKNANLSGALFGAVANILDVEEGTKWNEYWESKYPDEYNVGTNLRGAFLDHSNLRGTRLNWSNLQAARLFKADLEDAYMFNSDHSGAMGISDNQLARANILLHATMPDGERYDGRYNLPGDLHAASESGAIKKIEYMAEFYGVSLERYLHGQEWAQKNLHKLGDRDSFLTEYHGEVVHFWGEQEEFE